MEDGRIDVPSKARRSVIGYVKGHLETFFKTPKIKILIVSTVVQDGPSKAQVSITGHLEEIIKASETKVLKPSMDT